ncbi:Alpha/Beta hydrolase protein [Thelonectria olida]|uniref:Alpha/Beta hydrolase protein n=1 Tax=Thelonectria olida TaxID=1576542 RepID=A0A9P9AMQ2_9HYPO|nr:Alpha/Beta hydrolase protein [Thelonectria olida]
MAPLVEPEIKQYSLLDFRFLDGTTVPQARLAYLDLNPEASRVAVVLTCFRGRLRSTLHYANGALRNYRIIVVALFGNGESSSPSNTAGFPKSIDYQDCVRAQHQLVDQHLGVKIIDVLAGFSMGGQCAYYWTMMHPDMVKNAIVVCSSAQTSRHNYQFLEGPSAALENAIDYADEALRLAIKNSPRGLRAFGKAYSAWLTSAEWFDKELYRELGYDTLHDWDEDTTGRNYNGWAPDDLLAMLRMWQRADIRVCSPLRGGSLGEALQQIRARILLMPCQTDQYFDWRASQKESQLIQNATLRVIPSVWGHLAGSGASRADVDWMNQAIGEFLGTV